MKLTLRNNYHKAFTLLEIMLVVAIIALLLGVAMVGFGNNLIITKEVVTKAEIKAISTALQSYTIFATRHPTTEQGLEALVSLPTLSPVPKRWRPTMDSLDPDPWEHPYIYVSPGKHNTSGFDLSSAGADGKANTEDDITNWPDK